jgi:hypothetical protein
MKQTFRKSAEVQIVFAILAQWVAARLNHSGMTLPQWEAKGYKLSANKRSTISEDGLSLVPPPLPENGEPRTDSSPSCL